MHFVLPQVLLPDLETGYKIWNHIELPWDVFRGEVYIVVDELQSEGSHYFHCSFAFTTLSFDDFDYRRVVTYKTNGTIFHEVTKHTD